MKRIPFTKIAVTIALFSSVYADLKISTNTVKIQEKKTQKVRELPKGTLLDSHAAKNRSDLIKVMYKGQVHSARSKDFFDKSSLLLELQNKIASLDLKKDNYQRIIAEKELELKRAYADYLILERNQAIYLRDSNFNNSSNNLTEIDDGSKLNRRRKDLNKIISAKSDALNKVLGEYIKEKVSLLNYTGQAEQINALFQTKKTADAWTSYICMKNNAPADHNNNSIAIKKHELIEARPSGEKSAWLHAKINGKTFNTQSKYFLNEPELKSHYLNKINLYELKSEDYKKRASRDQFTLRLYNEVIQQLKGTNSSLNNYRMALNSDLKVDDIIDLSITQQNNYSIFVRERESRRIFKTFDKQIASIKKQMSQHNASALKYKKMKLKYERELSTLITLFPKEETKAEVL